MSIKELQHQTYIFWSKQTGLLHGKKETVTSQDAPEVALKEGWKNVRSQVLHKDIMDSTDDVECALRVQNTKKNIALVGFASCSGDSKRAERAQSATLCVKAPGGGLRPGYVLVDDEVGREAEHVSAALLVGPPSQAEGHEEEPRALQQSHLVVQVQVPEACGGAG